MPATHIHALAVGVETTGAEPDTDAVVALAAVGARIDPAGGRIDALQTLFTSPVDPPPAPAGPRRPAPGGEGPPGTDRASAGLLAAVRDFRPRLLAAHHAAFTSAFLPGLGGALTPDDVRWACTLRLAKHLWPAARDFGLQALCRACGLQDHVAGHAGPGPAFDASSCAVLLTAQCLVLTEAGHDVTTALLREWSATVPLEPKVPFGRYRGRYWYEVPRDYLEWILHRHRSGDPFAPEIVAAAEAALRGEFAVAPPDPPKPCDRP